MLSASENKTRLAGPVISMNKTILSLNKGQWRTFYEGGKIWYIFIKVRNEDCALFS